MDFYPLSEMEIGDLTIVYKSIVYPQNAHKTPVILLSGILSSQEELTIEAKSLAQEFPVYTVDLPGLGRNFKQAKEVSLLENTDYAVILKKFFDYLGLETVYLVGQSSSASIAFTFASCFEECVKKLILSGITDQLRESVGFILGEAVGFLEKEEKEKFASSIVLNMMNFSKRKKVQKSRELKQSLYDSLRTCDDNGKQCYRANFLRLKNQRELPKAPQCEVLILAGEYDNFTTPFESFEVSKKCPNSTFVLIKEADHMVTQEKRDVVTRVYRRYLNDASLKRMKDVEYFRKKDFPLERIRMEPRWFLNDTGFLDYGEGNCIPINVVDINNFGCRIFTSSSDHKTFSRKSKFVLHIPKEDIKVEVFIFKHAVNGHLRGIFKHYTFNKVKEFESSIDKVAMRNNHAYGA